MSKNYHDTTELERPPRLDIATTTADSITENKADTERKTGKGLGDEVKLIDDSQLRISQPFDKAWKLISIALKLSDMEISDLNREKGQYFVLFDPDSAENKSGESKNFFTDFFSKSQYPQGRYLLTLTEKEPEVILKVEFLEYLDEKSSVQDGYAAPAPAENGVAKLLQRLYATLHDDLHLE